MTSTHCLVVPGVAALAPRGGSRGPRSAVVARAHSSWSAKRADRSACVHGLGAARHPRINLLPEAAKVNVPAVVGRVQADPGLKAPGFEV